MRKKTQILPHRIGVAYETLRGRPPKPDYGILIVMPFLAAAGGSLVAYGLETAMEIRRTRGRWTEDTRSRGRRLAPATRFQNESASSAS